MRHATIVIAVIVTATAAPAADLFIAGTVGEVYKGDTETGGFEQFGGICLAPVQALAADDAMIYAGDQVGGVVRFDIESGDFQGVFFAPSTISAMLMDGTEIVASHPTGTIWRLDPASGDVEATFSSPVAVEAMTLRAGELYVAGPAGTIWKGDPVDGGFSYFACACTGPVEALAYDDELLFAGDTFGQIAAYDLATGAPAGFGIVPFAITAMVKDGPDLIASDPQGNVHRIETAGYTVLVTLKSPINIEAMLMPKGAPPCPGDVTGDGVVDVSDLSAVVLAWGSADEAADVTGDGIVSVSDLVGVLLAWGACP